MPTMVSRLPKFGSRSKHPMPPVAPGATRLTNGFYHHPGPTGGNTSDGLASSKQNGGSVSRTATSSPKAAPRKSTQDYGKSVLDAKGRGLTQSVTSLRTYPEGGAKPAQRSLKSPQTSVRPRPNSGSGFSTNLMHQKKTPASRSFSSEGFGSTPLADNDLIRSRSLTQVRPHPSPSHPIPRSKAQSSASFPPPASKKPLLSNSGPAPKPSGISYRLSRPSLLRQPRPLRAAPITEKRISVETPPTTESSPGLCPQQLRQSPVGLTHPLVLDTPPEAPPTSYDHVSAGGEEVCVPSVDTKMCMNHEVEDNDLGFLRLSSKNDDDDSGLDQSGSRIDRLSVNGAAETSLSFLEDWTIMGCTGDHGEERLTCLNHSDQEQAAGSSLDLSPSDSCGSGGTFLWDEEGLQPLGGAITSDSLGHSHHIGSFDSDISGSDFLNNLESCDLEDDDLMLDGDLLEETSLSDSHRLPLSTQWKSQLCWEQRRSPEAPVVTGVAGFGDLGLDVEELAEECSAVRSQLEFLQMFLQQDEDHTFSPDTDVSCQSYDSRLQVLLQEMQQLREDLRSRDRTIAQLSLQLSLPSSNTRCHCQETKGQTSQCTQTSMKEKESVASQTPWRDPKSQIFGPTHQDSLTLKAPPPADRPRPPSRPSLVRDNGKVTRSLLPSKLRLPLFHLSGSASSPSPVDLRRNSKIKAPPSSPSTSRLPKPKLS